jgi:hypothetical protein
MPMQPIAISRGPSPQGRHSGRRLRRPTVVAWRPDRRPRRNDPGGATCARPTDHRWPRTPGPLGVAPMTWVGAQPDQVVPNASPSWRGSSLPHTICSSSDPLSADTRQTSHELRAPHLLAAHRALSHAAARSVGNGHRLPHGLPGLAVLTAKGRPDSFSMSTRSSQSWNRREIACRYPECLPCKH